MRRRLLRSVLVLAAGLVVALGGALLTVVVRGDPPPPPWVGSRSACRTDAMEHVHDPSRLEVRAACATFTGRVTSVRSVPAFNDVKVTLAPTADMRKYLPGANDGVLVADVIATDQAKVDAPAVGTQVAVSGAWVHDKATKTAMMLPAYRFVVQNRASVVIRGQSSERHGPQVPRSLKLSVHAPVRVPVGGEIPVTVTARWSAFGSLSAASQIRLFIEMTTPDGTGVRWKAAMTNTRGLAVVRLVAIQVPATYTITVYAAPSKRSATATTRLHVAHR